MASERTNDEGLVVVKAEIARWPIKQEEKALFARAEVELPNWRLADKARRMLADLTWHFSDQMPPDIPELTGKCDAGRLHRELVISTASIAVRAAGSAMVLLSAGYGPEAGGTLRRLLEAKLNTQAALDDSSGQYAVRYIRGRPKGTTKLAQKYGAKEEVDLLSVLTHADVRGLSALDTVASTQSAGGGIQETFSLMPFHRRDTAEYFLHAVAYECGLMCGAMAQAFGVAFEIPPWVSGQLIQMRDKVEAAAKASDAKLAAPASGVNVEPAPQGRRPKGPRKR